MLKPALRARRFAAAASQRGLSIVEMMVGMTIGLLVVAAASMVVTTQLGENRKLLVEVQIQQDLRASADIVTRELRRAGAWTAAQTSVWSPTNPNPLPNAYATVTLDAIPGSHVDYRYKRVAGDTGGPYGFKLEGGAIKSLLGGAWQELTDSRTLKVTGFTITPKAIGTPFQLPCPKACSSDPDDTSCWPTITVREFEVAISGEAVSDASVKRTVRTNVRLRNDWVQYKDAANPAKVCPS
jgi:type IV pilus assembly protein PilW